MKTKLTFSFLLSFFFGLLSSQIPQGFNYQAVVRDLSGNPITNISLPVRITVQADSLGTSVIWRELHSSVTSNSFGLITLVLGRGTKQAESTVSTFSAIDWSITPKFIKTEIDYGGWKTMGVSRFWSIPYAMTAGNIAGPVDKLGIVGTTSLNDEALFEVKNKNGNTVFAVYNEGVRVYVSDGEKGIKGGFAVGGFGTDKAESQKYLVVSKDSIRIYLDVNPATKPVKGGFAVGGYDMTKAGTEEYLRVTRDSTRVYVKQPQKGVKGGFAVGGFDATKGPDNNYITMTPENYFIGLGAGKSTTTGTFNSFMGYQNGYSNTTGGQNVLLGYRSGFSNKTGDANVMIGNLAGYTIPEGTGNTFIGTSSGQLAKSGNSNVFLGAAAGYRNEANYNIFIGNYSGINNTIGTNNLFAGVFSGAYNRKGSNNIYLGNTAGFADTTGNNNVFLGNGSGYSNQASNNIMIGYNSGFNSSSGNNNIFMGTETGVNNKGVSNIFFGFQSGYYNSTGMQNTFLGTQAGFANTTGYNNIFLGTGAGQFNTEGANNVFMGMQTGNKNTTGSLNTSLGYLAGFSNMTGNLNVFLGNMAGYYETGSNRLYISNTTADKNNALIYGEFDNKYFTVNGNLGIWKTSPAVKIDIAGGNWNVSSGEGDFRIGDDSYRFKIGVANAGGGAGDVRLNAHGGTNRLIFGGGGNDVLQVTSADILPWANNTSALGSSTLKWTVVYATNGTIQTSDVRLKENISEIGYGLESLLKLKPVSFNWKDDSNERVHLGLIAQDVELVINEVVDQGEDPSQILGINYTELVPVLIKSIQEQQKQIDELKALVEKLLQKK